MQGVAFFVASAVGSDDCEGDVGTVMEALLP
jgi:hypothetical protein